MQGNIRAAVCWITECSSGAMVWASDTTCINHSVMSVVDSLKLKHPESQIPLESTLPCCYSLLYFVDDEITVAHGQTADCRLQGGLAPGSCDSRH